MANIMLSLKTAVISTGIISLAVLFKVSAPFVTEVVTSGIPSTYGLILSFLRPPYLYLLINCIIITIVASSKLQRRKPESSQPNPLPDIVSPAFKVSSEVFSNEFSYGNAAARILVEKDSEAAEEIYGACEFVGGGSAEKPPLVKRFGQRKAVKAAPEGKALRVSKPKRHDTLESTWKTITEGRPMPLTRHLKKFDTWERAQKDFNTPPPPLPNAMKKSDTFNEHTKEPPLTRSSVSGKLKRDPSLSQDELNRRVEAFIKKFNDEMRLQRQESLNQCQEMLSRGAQ
ncbi:uncharacterized protein LOC120147753 [Hibiscus syriacus]|uniref:uncharacterized protein LOC120147753 n=1 Tax=Hibiscus syriacus TaxID=106335 RepID=UPI00192301F1|nr:uncharacterized protein LOC120147753 [Hibiscus syriacus]